MESQLQTCRIVFWRAFLAVAAGLLALPLTVNAGQDGDILPGNPVVGKNADGHLEVFKVEADGELRHRWEKSSGDWSSWSGLGRSFLAGIAVAKNSAGQLEVFAVDRESGELKFIRQKTPNSLDWLGWAGLGGTIRPPIRVGQYADGRLEVFAVDPAGRSVKHLWQTTIQNGWSDWASLGGNVEPGLAVTKNRDGRLELFAVNAADGSLVHCWQRRANGFDDWSDWTSLGGTILPGFGVGQNVAGRLEVFGVNRVTAAVNRISQLSANNPEWSPWEDFGGNAKDGLAVGQSADGRIEIFAVNRTNDLLIHRWETLTNGADLWSAWSIRGESARPYPAVIQNNDGNLELFVVDAKDPAIINHRRQISAASDWLDWSSLDHSTLQYASRTWQTDEGLPDNAVQAIAQTRDGYLWVGTRGGLAKFDGLSFTAFGPGNTPEIKNPSITALCADRQGALWIGTDGGGLTRLSGRTFSQYNKTNGLAGNNLTVIYESKDGSLWIGTTTGMSRYKGGTFTNYGRKQGLSSDNVRSIHEDRAGDLWIATGEGLNRLRGTAMDSFPMPNGLPNDSVRGICQDRGGRIWIGSNNGLLWYNSYWVGSFFAYNTRYGLSDSFVSAICEDRAGNFWVGTYSGLNRFREGRFFNELNNEGLPFDKVNVIFEDREGSVWVGSREGLARLTPKPFFTYTKRQGLTHNNIMSVREDRVGSLWIGTWGGGLDQMKDERVIARTPTNDFSRELILSTEEGRDGNLWIGADYDGGLTRLKDGKLTHYTWKDGLINAGARVIHEDRAGNLWIGTSRGLSCLREGKFKNYTIRDQLAGNAVRAICEDHAGNLWFGTETGLSRWKNGRFVNFTTREGLSDNTVIALYEDAAQDLWIGTGGGGLNRYRDGRFRSYTSQQGLSSDEIFEILEDDQGWLWMSCSKGVFRVLKKNLDDVDQGKKRRVACIAYGKTDGMESAQCNGLAKPAAWKTRDGRLWFPTSKGLVMVDPKTIKINQTPPPVYIERALADKKPLLRDGLAVNPSAPEDTDPPAQIPPGRGELEFHYTALSFQTPEKSRFKYKLEGVDLDWRDADTRRTAYYNSLPPGSYRFRVMACNNDGVWNEAGASLAFVLAPHLWETGWFRGLAALALLGAATGVGRYVTRKKMQRKLELLERRHAIEKERGRIAKDIHDDLGSSLTRIMMLGERAEEGLVNQEDVGFHVRKIVNSARDTVKSLDEIVWAVNPENDSLDGLIEYISHYADEFFENTNVNCRLEMPLQLPRLTLPADARHDLFLVVKEAFHNVLKHAGATEVRVRATESAGVAQIIVEDNGCGFSVNGNGSGRKGNGLENMRRRVAGLGGRFSVATTPGKGTKLTITAGLDRRRGPA
jgi:ligand-binding sensor domain-containing protein/signal transduction histidine kinase